MKKEMTATTGTGFCAHCAAKADLKGFPPMVTGTVATPGEAMTVDFSTGKFESVLDAIRFHRQVDGRPVIEHWCPAQGHQVWLYTDIEGVGV
jgi:hypothetical protein